MPNGLQKSLFCRMLGTANFTLSGCINRSRSMWVDPAGPQYCGYAAYGVQNDPKTGGPEGAGAAAGPACAGCRCRRRSRVVREGAVNGLVCPNCPDRSTNVTRHCKYKDNIQRYMCKDCRTTFNDRTGTLLHYKRISMGKWMLSVCTCAGRSTAYQYTAYPNR